MNLWLAVNPYSGADFLSFFSVLAQRLLLLIQGHISFQDLASDEVQIVVLVLLSLSLAFLGSFLVLKQMTMLANALSHTILLGIVMAYLLLYPVLFHKDISASFSSLKVLLIASLLTGLLTTVLTQVLSNVFKLQEDASIGLVFTTLFAIGIVLVTVYTRNVHIGTEAIMGNIDALHQDDIKTVGYLALLNLFVFIVLFKEFVVTTFDPVFSQTLGWPIQLFNYLMMILTAATSIAAFRAVGVLLFLAFLVGPVLIARLLTCSLKKLIGISFIVGSLCSVASVALSRHCLSVYRMPLSTAGMVVTSIAVVYFLLLLLKAQNRWIRQTLKINKTQNVNRS
jgi:manganese/zinc/iron transport system permease protein